MKQPFQIAQELVDALNMPERLSVSEGRALDPSAPNIYINDYRIVGGKPAIGRNVIRDRTARTSDILQAIPTDALRKIHAAICSQT